MRTLALIIAILLAAGACGAQEWPTPGHDPQRTGYSENLGPESPEVAWSVHVGSAVSPPSVADHTVYFGAENIMYALSAFNGSPVWSVEADGRVSPPTVHGGKVYFGSSGGTVYCLDAAGGNTVWSHPVNGGATEAIAVSSGTLYLSTSAHYVYALRASDGGFLWAKILDGVLTAPATDGTVIAVANNMGRVFALDTLGNTIWSAAVNEVIKLPPVISGGKVWVAGGGKLFLLENGAMLREIRFQADVNSFSVSGGMVYVGCSDGSVEAITESGAVTWRFEGRGGGATYLAAAGNSVFAWSGGRLYSLSMDKGETLWVMDIGTISCCQPAIAYGKLFIGSSDGVYCIGSWGSIPNGSAGTGLLYICIAALLLLAIVLLEKLEKGQQARKRRA
jgi:outer membrane protein assembly factor BamB